MTIINEGELAASFLSNPSHIPFMKQVFPAPKTPKNATTDPGLSCLDRVTPTCLVSSGKEEIIFRAGAKLLRPHYCNRENHLFQGNPPMLKAVAVFPFVFMVVGGINKVVILFGKEIGGGQTIHR